MNQFQNQFHSQQFNQQNPFTNQNFNQPQPSPQRSKPPVKVIAEWSFPGANLITISILQNIIDVNTASVGDILGKKTFALIGFIPAQQDMNTGFRTYIQNQKVSVKYDIDELFGLAKALKDFSNGINRPAYTKFSDSSKVTSITTKSNSKKKIIITYSLLNTNNNNAINVNNTSQIDMNNITIMLYVDGTQHLREKVSKDDAYGICKVIEKLAEIALEVELKYTDELRRYLEKVRANAPQFSASSNLQANSTIQGNNVPSYPTNNNPQNMANPFTTPQSNQHPANNQNINLNTDQNNNQNMVTPHINQNLNTMMNNQQPQVNMQVSGQIPQEVSNQLPQQNNTSIDQNQVIDQFTDKLREVADSPL